MNVRQVSYSPNVTVPAGLSDSYEYTYGLALPSSENWLSPLTTQLSTILLHSDDSKTQTQRRILVKYQPTQRLGL